MCVDESDYHEKMNGEIGSTRHRVPLKFVLLTPRRWKIFHPSGAKRSEVNLHASCDTDAVKVFRKRE